MQAFSSLTNSGTIAATGTAASVASGTIDNSGAIRSSGGVGLQLASGTYYIRSTSSGSIAGATTGASVSNATIANSGTITGIVTGVSLSQTGTLVNATGATITGGTASVINVGLNARVVNAGTLNGTVNFVPTTPYDSSNDIFVDQGGTVNGAIRLGAGDDVLVVDLAQTAGCPLAGATGGVDPGAGYDTLRYKVNADASAALARVSGFEALGYELDNNAALSLTAAQPLETTIGLAGNGSVRIAGSVSATNRTLIDMGALTTNSQTLGIAGPAGPLMLVNNGALSLTVGQQTSYTLTAAVLAATNTAFNSNVITNNGSITVINSAGSYYPAYAIYGGAAVTNAGTITVTGGTAIAGSATITNTGTITDVAGSGGSGVSANKLTNSGTIRVDQTAAYGSGSGTTIVNTGTIESRRGTAVLLDAYGTLTNQAGGNITGQTTAVSLSGNIIINHGAIIGDVSSYAFSTGANAYVSDGGTLRGNVIFGTGSDTFLQYGADDNGVSGTVDGGLGTNTYGYVLTSNGSVSIGPRRLGFDRAACALDDRGRCA